MKRIVIAALCLACLPIADTAFAEAYLPHAGDRALPLSERDLLQGTSYQLEGGWADAVLPVNIELGEFDGFQFTIRVLAGTAPDGTEFWTVQTGRFLRQNTPQFEEYF